MGAATIPVLGGALLGGSLLLSLLHKKRKYDMTQDPFSSDHERNMFFNTTMPFERQGSGPTAAYQQVNQTLGKLNGSIDQLNSTVKSFDTMTPGLVVKNG